MHLWETPVGFGVGALTFTQTLHFWVNDGLMTIFFLLVGLEIRREIYDGALTTLRAAALPMAAACGGVLVPALIYLAVNASPGTARGWAIPTATDIAFAIGALTLLGARVAPGLRVFLLAIAIIDDIIAILIIAFFYSDGISAHGLGIAVAAFVAILALQRLGLQQTLPYAIPGAVMWGGLLSAGIHPALAGVILGLLTPVAARGIHARDRAKRLQTSGEVTPEDAAVLSPVVRLQAALHPWVAFGIMPAFALANAGLNLSGLTFTAAGSTALALGIAAALVIGKPLGIVSGAMLCIKTGVCTYPAGVGVRGIAVVGCLGGIGFTMSIFVAALAFTEDSALMIAKLAVLIASGLAAILGLVLGYRLLHLPAASRGDQVSHV